LRVEPSAQPNSHRKNRFEQSPIREERGLGANQEVGLVSAVAVIVVIVVALLLASVLAAALRRDAGRQAHHGPSDDPSFRSHAEASRGDHP
jgi:hypothetical protein